MTKSMLNRYNNAQNQMVLAALPRTSHIDPMPEIDLAMLLARMERERIQRKGAR